MVKQSADEKQDNIICLGVRIPKEMHEALAKAAKDNDLTMSQVVRIAIKDFIKKMETA